MKRYLVVAAAIAAVASLPVYAQNAVTFEVDLSNPLAPVATWAATPAAGASCEASGAWTGSKAASGTETLGAIRSSSLWALQCSWPGETIATLTWVNPTENDDGTAYTNPGVTRLVWTSSGNLSSFDCLQPSATPSIQTTDRPADQTMHTITGLTPGTWNFAAYAVNTLGLCSTASNIASKTITGPASLSDSVSVKVPGAPSVDVE